MNIGENIKRIRKQKGLTQKKLSELCGINEAQIRRYELGKKNANPKIETIKKIADALNVDMDEIIKSDTQEHGLSVDEIETIHEMQNALLNYDNKERNYLLIYYYNTLKRSGRDALIEILSNLRVLNESGHREASKRVEELTEIKKYTEQEDE